MACVRFGKCRPADLTALFPRRHGSGQGSAARRGNGVFDFTRGERFGLDEPKFNQAGDEALGQTAARWSVIQEVAFGRRQVHDWTNVLWCRKRPRRQLQWGRGRRKPKRRVRWSIGQQQRTEAPKPDFQLKPRKRPLFPWVAPHAKESAGWPLGLRRLLWRGSDPNDWRSGPLISGDLCGGGDVSPAKEDTQRAADCHQEETSDDRPRRKLKLHQLDKGPLRLPPDPDQMVAPISSLSIWPVASDVLEFLGSFDEPPLAASALAQRVAGASMKRRRLSR